MLFFHVLVASLVLGGDAWAQEALQPLPTEFRAVSDEIGTLTDEEGGALARFVEDTRVSTGVREVVVVVRTTAPEVIEDYARRLAIRWTQERSADMDRTVFVVLAVDDRAMHIFTGHALARDAALVRSAVVADLVPLARSGRYFEVLMTLSSRIREALQRMQQRG